MKILQVSAGGVSALFLVVLMVGSASAAPILSVGSNANYHLNASMQSTQSCNASPVSYNQTACGPYQPKQLVNIYDDAACGLDDTMCHFSPANITVFPGTTVQWFNSGKMTHTVTSSSGPAVFDSGSLAPLSSFSFTFSLAGNYSYHCSIHPWMQGTVRVPLVFHSLGYGSPTVTINPTISLAGSLSWTVNGLNNNVAVLNVSHQVSIVATEGPITFTPATETGSFSQSIDLATRVESSGTATSALLGIIEKLYGYYGYYPYGYSPKIGQLLSSSKERYTFWWVNGPLNIGQPVEILTGYSSVTGIETVNMGPGNNVKAWIVESTLSQDISTTSPPVVTSGGSTDSSFNLDLRFDYGQASDLLLKSSGVVSVTSAQVQNYNPADYLCGPSGCFPVSDHVSVSHHMSATTQVTLQLTTTSINLARRDPPGGSTGNALTALLPIMSLWAYAGIGIVGATVAVTAVWLLRRHSRARTPVGQPGPVPATSPPLAGP